MSDAPLATARTHGDPLLPKAAVGVPECRLMDAPPRHLAAHPGRACSGCSPVPATRTSGLDRVSGHRDCGVRLEEARMPKVVITHGVADVDIWLRQTSWWSSAQSSPRWITLSHLLLDCRVSSQSRPASTYWISARSTPPHQRFRPPRQPAGARSSPGVRAPGAQGAHRPAARPPQSPAIGSQRWTLIRNGVFAVKVS